MNDWNQTIIDEFRSNGGKVGGPFEGSPIVLLHTTGAKSEQPRVNPLMSMLDGDRWIIFAPKAGSGRPSGILKGISGTCRPSM